MIPSIDYLTLVIAGSVMTALTEPDIPENRGALTVFLLGIFVFVIGVVSALRSALGL